MTPLPASGPATSRLARPAARSPPHRSLRMSPLDGRFASGGLPPVVSQRSRPQPDATDQVLGGEYGGRWAGKRARSAVLLRPEGVEPNRVEANSVPVQGHRYRVELRYCAHRCRCGAHKPLSARRFKHFRVQVRPPGGRLWRLACEAMPGGSRRSRCSGKPAARSDANDR